MEGEWADYESLGERVRERRLELGMTREKLAEYCDISVSHLSHIEAANTKLSMEVLLRLCEVMKMTPNELLVENIKPSVYAKEEIMSLLDKCSPKTLELVKEMVEAVVEAQRK